MNKIITIGYFLFIAIPLVFTSVACYSYFSILNSLGDVPPYEDGVYAFAKTKGVSIKIFPIKYGDTILTTLFYAFFSPFYIVVNYVLFKINSLFAFQKKLAFTLISEYVITLLLLTSKNAVGWYAGFILD